MASTVMQAFGSDLTEEETAELYRRADADNSGSVSEHELANCLAARCTFYCSSSCGRLSCVGSRPCAACCSIREIHPRNHCVRGALVQICNPGSLPCISIHCM